VSLPIRSRLTIWYSAILLFVLLVFGAIVEVAVRAAINGGVDSDLETRLAGLQSYMQRQLPRYPRNGFRHEFEEHVALRPGGEMMQIADSVGNWIFQSESITGLHLPPAGGATPHGPVTQVLRGVPIRVRWAVVQVNAEAFHVQLATTLGPSYAALDRFRELLLALIPTMLVAASAGGYWLSTRALAPVDRIIDDARAISSKNIARRLFVPRSGDELQRLAETLNAMMQRLETAFLRITQFTADASHEFRAPVAFIRTTAEVALLERRDSKSYRNALKDILAEAERTTRLVEDLLTLARADSSSAARVAMQPVDLKEPLREVCSQALAIATCKNIQFSHDLPSSEAPVMGDFDMIRRLFLILVDNAIKYTPTGGDVAVGLLVDATGPVVMVRDSGIGIAPEDLDHIFERFYRADKARQRDLGGVGLGLSIAQWIAAAHHAIIQVESVPALGSTFTVRFLKPDCRPE